MPRYMSKPDYDVYKYENNLGDFSLETEEKFENHLKQLSTDEKRKFVFIQNITERKGLWY